ncbi:unnamed protein product, partial [Amoebophrya sp. A25]
GKAIKAIEQWTKANEAVKIASEKVKEEEAAFPKDLRGSSSEGMSGFTGLEFGRKIFQEAIEEA